jgi:putative FmdB family regulatory protein
MSKYDYECEKCKTKKEIERPITAPATQVVCDCGEVMHRCWSVPSIEFKGAGWQSNEVKR